MDTRQLLLCSPVTALAYTSQRLCTIRQNRRFKLCKKSRPNCLMLRFRLTSCATAGILAPKSWLRSAKRDFYTIGAIKTNRLVTIVGGKLQLGQLAAAALLAGLNADLVTVGKRQFFVSSFRVTIEGIGEVVVLLSYPREAFGKPSALRAFLCTDCSLSITEILDHYVVRWNIEVFFRNAKQKLSFDKYQIRSSTGIKRFWLLMSLAHFICCVGTDETLSFEEGFSYFQKQIQRERIEYVYRCGYAHLPLDDVLALVA